MSLPEQEMMLYQRKAIFSVCARPNRTNAVFLWPAFSALISAFSAILFALLLAGARVIYTLKMRSCVNFIKTVQKTINTQLKLSFVPSHSAIPQLAAKKFPKHHHKQHYRIRNNLFPA